MSELNLTPFSTSQSRCAKSIAGQARISRSPSFPRRESSVNPHPQFRSHPRLLTTMKKRNTGRKVAAIGMGVTRKKQKDEHIANEGQVTIPQRPYFSLLIYDTACPERTKDQINCDLLGPGIC